MKHERVLGALAVLCLAVAGCTPTGDTHPAGRDAEPAELEYVWDLSVSKPDLPARTEVLVDGSQLFAIGTVGKDGASNAAVAAFDLVTGEKQWFSDPDVVHAWVTSELVVIEFEGGLVQVLERDSGDARFELEAAESPRAVAVTNDGIAVADDTKQDEQLRFVGLDSGREKWSAPIDDASVLEVSAPVRALKVFGAGTRKNASQISATQDSPLIYTHARGSKEEAVSYAVDGGKSSSDGRALDWETAGANTFMTMTQQGNTLAVTKTDECETSYSVTGTDEPEHYTVNGTREDCSDFGFAEQFADDKVYGRDSQGLPTLFDANSGKPLWSAKEEGVPLTFADGVATYGVGDDCDVHAVDMDTGRTLWAWEQGTYFCDTVNSHVATPDVLVFGDVEESFGIDPSTGDLMWRAPGVVVDWTDDYLVLQTGALGEEQQSIKVSTHTGK